MALLTLLTACQPTPEAEPVKQKDTEKLIEMAVTTAPPATEDASEETEAPASPAEPVPFSERFSERFTVDYTTTTSGAKVVGNVKIQYLSDTAFPMYRMNKALPAGEMVRELAKRLLGAEEVYEKTLFQSKADVKAEIDRISELISRKDIRKERMEDLGETEEEVELWLEEMQKELKELQTTYNAMTGEEERPLFESWDGTYSKAPLEKDQYSHHFWLVAENDAFGNTPTVNVFYGTEKKPDFNLVFYRNSSDSNFGYHISEVAAVYTKMRNNSMEEVGQGSYTSLWTHEQIEVAVNEEGVRACSWSGHMEVQEMLTGDVNLLDFDTVYNLFTQQMNRKLATEDADTEIKLTGVTLGLMRIREEDSPHTALLVPVWYFRGLEGKTDYYQEVLGEDKWPLCVLNAIDGSVIDSTLGY